MIAIQTTHAAYEATLDGSCDSRASTIWQHMLAALRSLHPGTDIPDQDGVCESVADDGSLVRYGRDNDSGFWSVEVLDLLKQDFWSGFLLPMPDGSWRTGWSRSGPHHAHEPAAWVDCAAHLHLGQRVQPHHPPSFAALVATMSSACAPTFSRTDQPAIDALNRELDEQRRMLRDQAVTIRTLRASLAAPTGETAPAAPQRTWTMADMGEWAAENADRIVILPRAISEAKKSHYSDPALVYSALEILADVYPQVRAGLMPREELAGRCAALGLTIGGSVDPTHAGSAGDEYFVRWRGRRRFLDQHVGRGSSRDPRWCLRIYFFFDEELQQVVCGWLPSHLSNSLT